MKEYTLAEFHAACKAQGVPHEDIALPEDAAFDKYLGFSCVGRWTNAGGPFERDHPRDGSRPCNWTLGGLFSLHEAVVLTPDGQRRATFDLATPAQAQAHAALTDEQRRLWIGLPRRGS